MEKKAPIKMRRVDQDVEPAVTAPDAGDKPFQAVRQSSDMIVVTERQDDYLPADTSRSEMASRKILKDAGGMVTIMQDDDMEEVSYEDYTKSVESALSSNNESVKDKILALAGKSADVVKAELQKMVNQKLISEYRFVAVGVPTTMDVVPGRVQAIMDMTKRVIDLQVG